MKSLFLAVFMTVAMVLSACGSKSDGGSGDSANNNNSGVLPTAADCDTIWAQMIATMPVGFYTKYVTKNAGMSNSSSTEESRVVESNNDRLVTDVKSNGVSSTQTLTHINFKSTCEKGKGQLQMPDNTKVLAERDEAVTVPAGTFTTHYTKYQFTSDQNNMPSVVDMEVWMSKDNMSLPIKVITTSTMSFQGQSFVMTSTRELVEMHN